MKKLNYILALTLLTGTIVMAQKPVPAPPQSKPIALTGGTAHIGNGQVIENALITFDKGKLTNVVDGSVARIDLSGYEVISAAGKHIYPGFILPNSQVGLEEVSAVRAMSDSNEEGDINPNVRSVISYNADSEFPPTFRFNWPAMVKRQFSFATFSFTESPNKEYDNEVTNIEHFFMDAVAYGNQVSKETNLKLASMQGLFDGTKTLFIHTNSPKEIITAVRKAQQFGVKRITLLAGDAALISLQAPL